MASIPRYQRLTELLREKLKSGKYKVGDRFHSQNELMRIYQLSYATVTRALNDLELEGTLVRKQGKGTFVRSIPDSASGTTKSLQVKVLIPWDARSPAHLNFQRLYGGVESHRPAGCQLSMAPYATEVSDIEALLFSREAIDGVMFAYPGERHLPIIHQVAREYPTVVIGRAMPDCNVSCVWTSNQRAAAQAVEHLIKSGHRRIGMISGALEMTDSRERLAGYRSALRKTGLVVDEELIIFTDPIELNGYGATLELFDRNVGPEITAVFAAGDILALGALSALRSMQKRVPEDVSVMGFDDISGAADLTPPLTTMHVPIEGLGRTAIELLLEKIEGHPPRIVELPAELMIRGSTAAKRSSGHAGATTRTAR